MRLAERLVASVTDIRTRGRRLVQLNRELLTAELKERGQRFGAATALFIAAGVLALYVVGFALATIAVALALVLPLWLALLIVTAVLFLIVTIMALVGRSMVQQAKKRAPESALAEARTTAGLVKANVRETVAGVRAKVAPQRRARGRGPATPAPVSATPAPVPATQRPGQGDQPPGRPPDDGARVS